VPAQPKAGLAPSRHGWAGGKTRCVPKQTECSLLHGIHEDHGSIDARSWRQAR
jgi:hypothetical protein